MSKKLMTISVGGKHKKWIFEVYADPKYLDEWRADGIEIDVLENTIPMWVVDAGAGKIWCFFQDLFNFKNPFAK